MTANETPKLLTKSMGMGCHGHYVYNRDVALISNHEDMTYEPIHCFDSKTLSKQKSFRRAHHTSAVISVPESQDIVCM